jgi:cytochrome c-type biogenesis protein
MFGIEIIDAALLPAMLVALVAGVLSFLSPCVLPIVPPYLAYMGGISMGEMTGQGAARKRVILPAVFFVLGLSTIFLLLGFTASAFGSFVLENQVLLARISGLVIIIFGLHFLGVFRIPLLDREVRMDAGDRGGSALGAYVLGLAFAFGWTPWARSCRLRRRKAAWSAARFCWASMPWAWGCPSCWPRFSSRNQCT